MNSTRIRLVICFMVLLGLMAGFTTTAWAAPSLHWQTEQVYYDNQGRLVIEGYFYNNGTRTINWINWHAVNVYFRQYDTRWWLQAQATFRDLNVTLYPGDTLRWTFRITNVGYSYFDYWDVKWTANYHYL